MSSLPPTMTPLEAVDALVEFLSTRLLLKRYRRGNRTSGEPLPAEVAACEQEFTRLALDAVNSVARADLLDAMDWMETCSAFSEKWMEVCHWVSPKKFREHLTATIGAEWAREDEIPAERELPPIDLKWYKTPEGVDSVQPCVCPVCSIVCNSLAQYKAHAQGRMHKSQARNWSRRNGGRAVEPLPLETQSPRRMREMKARQRMSSAISVELNSMSPMSSVQMSPCSELSPAQGPGTPLSPSRPMSPPSMSPLMQATPAHVAALDASTTTVVSVKSRQTSFVIQPYQDIESVYEAYSRTQSSLSCSVLTATQTSFCSASSGGHETPEEDSTDDLAPVLDTLFPVPARAQATPVDAATRERLTVLDSILARLTHDASAAAANKALSLATSLANSGAAEQVLQALMDAAVQADEAAAVALVAAAVAEEVAGFPVMLGDAVVELATQGMSTTASEHEEGVFFEAKTRSRHGGLVRFASALVGHDALPACVLLKCVATALEDATAEDVANAYRAVAAVRLGAEEEAEARAMFRGAVKAKYYPGYVKAMVAPLMV